MFTMRMSVQKWISYKQIVNKKLFFNIQLLFIAFVIVLGTTHTHSRLLFLLWEILILNSTTRWRWKDTMTQAIRPFLES